MAAPIANPDEGFGKLSNTPGPNETNHDEPVADDNEILEHELIEKDLAAEKHNHQHREEVEESPSPIEKDDDEADFEKELQAKKGRQQLERSQSNFTQTTGTSVASSLPADLEDGDAPIKKRSLGQRLNPLRRKVPPPIPDKRPHNREHEASWISKLTFQWMAPLMAVGYQRPLEVNDIWEVNPDRSIEVMKAKLTAAFERRKKLGTNRPLFRALVDTYHNEFYIGAVCQLTAALLQVLTPFVMKYLIAFSGEAYYASLNPNNPQPGIGRGIGLVFGITCMQIIQSITTNHFIYRGMMVGGQARSVLISMIFEKAMRLSGRAKAGGVAIEGEKSSEKEEKEEEKPEPGSEKEKSFFKRKLGKSGVKDIPSQGAGQKGVAGDGAGWSNGRIVNLMSTDTYRVDQASGFFHMIWTAPIQVLLTLALLLVNLTYSALAGFAFICIMMPLLARSIKSLMKRRVFINKITDQRVSLTQEILSSVRFVKFFGWETSFLGRLGDLRNKEINRITILLSIRNAILAVSLSLPIFASMLAFITFSLTHDPASFSAAAIFSSLALFNALRIPLNLLPMVIGQVVDANASLQRMQAFFDAEETPNEADWIDEAKDAISIDNASFTWERTRTQSDEVAQSIAKGKPVKPTKQDKKDAKVKAQEAAAKAKLEKEKHAESGTSTDVSSLEQPDEEEHPFEIQDISLSIGRNELVAVIGAVGSGKSSLLAALAGDMRRTAGSVTFGANRAFCPQYAWIQNATVKENITFSRAYDRRWYNKVVDACALRPDLEMLPAGDLTEIGERGITVSGGQKQRLNIARAIYFNADIVIMDDPLSAVDAHVGRHIMDEAICGLLKDKARVLATHQLHVLHRVDRIVWMKEGRIAKIATFDELMTNDEEFQQLMKTTASKEEEEEADVNEADLAAADDEKKKKKDKVVTVRRSRKKEAALMQQEERAVNGVDKGVYLAYIKAAGTVLIAPLVLFILVASQGANIMTSLWLSFWTSGKYGLDLGTYIGVYAALAVVQAILTFAFATTLTYYGTKASKVMLQRAIYRVLRAPMSFFDTTPMGRITNRFSKDVDTMDNSLTDSIRMFSMTFVTILSVFILIIAYYYYFAVALVPLTVAFLFSANYYRASARELKRHEAVLRSVVFARFGEAVNGISTIRAYGVERQFAQRVDESIDSMDGAYFLTFSNQRWLSTRLDAVGNALVFTCGILVVTGRFSISPSTAGLILSYILSIVQMIQFSVRQLAEVENNMNSTERIHFYGTQLEEEAPLHRDEVRQSWPEQGEIVFEDVQMRYREGLPLVLKGLNMTVGAGERIGVVGRTGAGKSTIMSTLFRLNELSAGRIVIDGVDISQIGLADLRSRLAIIPQDPTLFRGTIRSNLDPFQEHTDLDLWNALRQADLITPDQKIDDDPNAAGAARIHLDTAVEDEGLNFSLGQRQLLALARALVRGSQIIVCDEATSSVDFETDQKIQQTIVRGFKGKTLLCIAHRLRTIIGYDRILVMDQGNVAELDSPLRLFEQEGSIFRGMCERSGIRREDFLVAKQEVN